MDGLLALSRAIDRLTTIVGRAVSWFILAAILISAVNAIIRKASWLWIDTGFAQYYKTNAWLEMQWYLFGAAFMGAAAYTFLQNEHIRIDLIYSRWSRRTQNWIDLFGHIFFLLPFVTLMVWYLYPWVMRSFRSHEMSTNAGGLVIWPAKAMLLVGFALLLAQAISEIIKRIAVLSGKLPDIGAGLSQHEALDAEAEAIARDMKTKLFVPLPDVNLLDASLPDAGRMPSQEKTRDQE
ncbi:TRAP transporter small permease subunit [Paracoccus aminophilus]|uniref:TRAP transporter small permease protein n=1 Tax=Paracoccus aminophilus JCM 7686 TaxID=1367847 RepID=S5YTV6_PARAH|nr:TRAP transporter small permease subunit [Paracoccus aminophilus]AGT08651.1 TRAP-type C4-dicarboxylate transport system, periplasmic component [Paracoccus aminophilus JCM 7686]